MQHRDLIMKCILILLMAATAVLFPAALYYGLSYDAIVDVLLMILLIALSALYRKHVRKDKGAHHAFRAGNDSIDEIRLTDEACAEPHTEAGSEKGGAP